MAGQITGIELSDFPDPGLAFQDGIPEGLFIRSQTCDHTYSGDNNGVVSVLPVGQEAISFFAANRSLIADCVASNTAPSTA